MKISVDGKEREVVHSFGEDRAIVEFDGAYVFVDRVPEGAWELSGEPARDGEEKQILNKLIAPHLWRGEPEAEDRQYPETD